MESAEIGGVKMDVSRILVRGSPDGHRVELIELAGGGFAIQCDGEKQAVYEVGACNLESCIKTYLGFVGSFRGSSASILDGPA